MEPELSHIQNPIFLSNPFLCQCNWRILKRTALKQWKWGWLLNGTVWVDRTRRIRVVNKTGICIGVSAHVWVLVLSEGMDPVMFNGADRMSFSLNLSRPLHPTITRKTRHLLLNETVRSASPAFRNLAFHLGAPWNPRQRGKMADTYREALPDFFVLRLLCFFFFLGNSP